MAERRIAVLIGLNRDEPSFSDEKRLTPCRHYSRATRDAGSAGKWALPMPESSELTRIARVARANCEGLPIFDDAITTQQSGEVVRVPGSDGAVQQRKRYIPTVGRRGAFILWLIP